MKKFSLFLLTGLFVAAAFSFQQTAAQEKTKEEQEKEVKILQAIEQQKREMASQKKRTQEERVLILKEKDELDEALQNIRVEVETSGRPEESFSFRTPRGDRNFPFHEPFIISSGVDPVFGHSSGGDSEKTTWEFSRAIKENTFSRNYSFDVEKTANTVVMSVMGDSKAGEIRIKIVMPNGKIYSDIVIDEFGNLNWRKSFSISETENQDKSGEWQFQIESKKATGFFKISLQIY
jgi:hypothetical protein